MAYSYINKRKETYFLHEKKITLKGSGKKQVIYFFKKQISPGSLDSIPDGFKVIEVERSGLPLLSKKT